jgi:ferrous iron transport protein B
VSDSGSLVAPPKRRVTRAALVGNPNVGKSAIFNRLTGLHQKVTNFPGVTVDRTSGRAETPAGPVEVIDLPGTYGLTSHSPEEEVVRDVVLHRDSEDAPQAAILVLDAANLSRNLFLALQVIETGLPCIAALNQVDLAEAAGWRIDRAGLEEELGIPVVVTNGRTGAGCDDLLAALAVGGRRGTPPEPQWHPAVVRQAQSIEDVLGIAVTRKRLPGILGSEAATHDLIEGLPTEAADAVREARTRITASGVDPATATAQARYRTVDALAPRVAVRGDHENGGTERLDRFFTHPLFGFLFLVVLFGLLFETLFKWSGPLMDFVEGLTTDLGAWMGSFVAEGLLQDLLVDGVAAGFAGVVVFVPQILILFLVIGALDDSGYLARAAFLLDRMMARMGLPGRAFLPLMSSFACAIPGVMAARTIRDPRDRLATMLAAPFMSCSARIPVYVMVIGALFSTGTVLGIMSTGTAVMFSMYLLGTVAGLVSALLLKKTILKGGRTPLLLELPPYRVPVVRSVIAGALRKTWQFVACAGPVILGLSIVLWFLAAFPQNPVLETNYAALRADAVLAADAVPEAEREAWMAERMTEFDRREKSDRMAHSYAGRLGKFIEPAIEPLGLDWKAGIGLVASFAAREVFVSTLSVVYAVAEDDTGEAEGLRAAIRNDVNAETGQKAFRPLTGLSLLVFFVLAMQCMSTLAVVYRETGGWKWPVAMFVWMTALAWLASFATYQIGSALGY